MAYLATGILLIISGFLLLAFGERMWRGTIIPAWMAWPEILAGVIMCVLAIRHLRYKKKHPTEPSYTEEEAARAEAEMDAAYLREHGVLPEKPTTKEKRPPIPCGDDGAYHTKKVPSLAALEIAAAWRIWLFFNALSGGKGEYGMQRCYALQAYFSTIPYEKILSMVKHAPTKGYMNPYSKGEITFYAFIAHPKFRQGLRASMVCIMLVIMIALGWNTPGFFLLAAVLALFGLIRLGQGAMDIL